MAGSSHRFVLLTALVALVASIAIAQPTKPTRPATPDHPQATRPVRPLRVFYCTHSAGFRHSVLPLSRQVVQQLGKDNDWLEVTVSNDIADLTPELLAKTDVVMFYTTGTLPMGDMKDRLIQWVHDGGGFVGIHAATDTFKDDPAYNQLVGGVFDGHPWNNDVRIIIDDPTHPAMLAFMPKKPTAEPSFHIADEIYQFRSLNPKMHVLAHLDPATPKAEPGRAYPNVWTLQPGKGRVFYTAFGHRPEVWKDTRFQEHLLAGIRWAAKRTMPVEKPDHPIPAGSATNHEEETIQVGG